MERETVLSLLSERKDELTKKYGVTRLGVFGSIARGEAIDGSDVDIVVDMPPDLFQMVHMKEELEEILVAPVDLVRLHKHINPLLRKRIQRDAVYV